MNPNCEEQPGGRVIPLQSYAASDRGLVRRENEDSYLLHIPDDEALLQQKGILAVVADGVGGGPAGKQASSLAVDIVMESYYRFPGEDNTAALRGSLKLANREIYKKAEQDPRLLGMATTCTAAAIRKGEAFLSHVGDSRAYVLRGTELRQLSEDHTLVNELIKEGVISREEGRTHSQRNIIVKTLGHSRRLEPDSVYIPLQEKDTLLLCSDGLHGFASDDEISSILSGHPAEEAGRRLIKLVLSRGGYDNVTVVIVRI